MKKPVPIPKNLWNIMKITFTQLLLLTLFCGLSMAHSSRAQEVLNRPITIRGEKLELKEVLSQIEREARVKFVYSTMIQSGQRVSLNVTNRKLSTVLDEVLKPIDIDYEVIENRILLKKTKPEADGSTGFVPRSVELPADRTVSGRITDENNSGLPGVSVVLKGTQRGTTTDGEGRFQLSIPETGSPVLVFSFVGYQSQEIAVGNQSTFNLALTPEDKLLNEVVVVGYGSVKRKDLTGAVAQVDSKDIEAFPVADVQQALRGRAPGVRVIQTSGQPGSSVQVQVRGGNSFLGNNNPLYVVDGFPLTGGIDFLNPSDIASIDILKDASATAIYGARGANGVVIITTRQGKEGRSRVSLDSYYGFQNAAKRFDLMNGAQYAEIANEQLTNDGKKPQFTGSDFANTDWQDQIFQTAPIQNHVLTLSGGNAKTRYSVSGNYFAQDGIILNSGTDRGSFRFGLDQDVSNRFSFSTHFVGTRFTFDNNGANNGHRGNNILSAAIVSPPTVPVWDQNGSYTDVGPYSFSPNVLQHPLLFNEILNQQKRTSLLADFSATLKITDRLSFKTLLGTEQVFNEG
ncbi:MAG: SusC/RagA family TonB-linked outer membrane protein, partial [Bacteroidetes bacterium]|nr:SusC/RagA family TonB-linked outer membrane protein [Bacteroidota bacterium]